MNNKFTAYVLLAWAISIAVASVWANLPTAKAETPTDSAYIGGGCYKYRHAIYCE